MVLHDSETSWAHRLAWLLACAVFPLIWMGGLVTTYDAGMSVPDWPTTYDYWVYPPDRWVSFWDIFLEHTHRLLAKVSGVLAIGLALVVWRRDARRWMWWVAGGVLAAILLQGTLGGVRVLWNLRLLARVHACTAPLFFTLCAAVVTWTGRPWVGPACRPGPGLAPQAGSTRGAARQAAPTRVAWFVALAIYAEIVLGTQLRRPAHEIGLGWLYLWVWAKVIMASFIVAGIAWLIVGTRCWRSPASAGGQAEPGRKAIFMMVRRRVRWLAAIFVVQLVLAGAAWVTHYGWPNWCTAIIGRLEYTVVNEGRLQVTLTTLHVAVGSLCLVAASNILLWMHRLVAQASRLHQETQASRLP